MNIRQRTESIEENILSDIATLSKYSTRLKKEESDEIRTSFQQDRDRILNSKAFRRLKHKAQMFIAPAKDHYRTRLMHTLEVVQVARTIARALSLNEDLAEAIALGHDLGHTPFGHAGENALNILSPEGFKHYKQSLRVVDRLENDGDGLNLTLEVRDGILNHTSGKASTIEGRIVQLADKIAFLNHDVDDAIRAKIIRGHDIPSNIIKTLGNDENFRINRLISSVVKCSNNGNLDMEPEVIKAFNELNEFMFEDVYLNIDKQEDRSKIPDFIARLYEYFKGHPDKLPEDMMKIADEEGIDKAVCDYIAGMTDHFAIEIFEYIFVPKSWER
jgi:dGTPase